MLREIIPEMLTALGYNNIDIAASGKEGLEKYLASDVGYSLVISDLNMPVMDGIEMYKRIMEERSVYSLNFLFMSGYSPDNKELNNILATNPNCKFIQKPLNLGELKSVMDSYE